MQLSLVIPGAKAVYKWAYQAEKLLIFLLFLVIPWQKRHIFYDISKYNGLFIDYWAVSIYLSDLVVFALILIIFRQLKLYQKFFVGAALFIIIILLLFPHETFSHSHELFAFLKIIEFYFVIYYFYNKFQQNQTIILIGLFFSGIFQAVIGLLQFFKQQSLGLFAIGEQIISPYIQGVAKIDVLQGKLVRAYGLFAHPNQLAAFLLVACATGILLFLFAKNTSQKILIAIGIFLVILGEFATFSRAGIAAMLICLAIIAALIWLKAPQIEKKAKTYLSLVMLLSIVISSALLWFNMKPRLTISDQATKQRIYLNRLGLESIKTRPLTGVGLGKMVPALIKKVRPTQTWQIQPPHNYFIIVAYETGIITATALLALFLWLLYKLFKIIKAGDIQKSVLAAALFSIFLSIMLLMQFDHYFYTQQQTALLLWVLVGIIMNVVFKKTAQAQQ